MLFTCAILSNSAQWVLSWSSVHWKRHIRVKKWKEHPVHARPLRSSGLFLVFSYFLSLLSSFSMLLKMTLVSYCLFLCYRKEGPYEVYWGTKKSRKLWTMSHITVVSKTLTDPSLGFCSSIPSKNRMRPVWFSQNTKRNLNRPAPKDAVIMSSGSGPFLLHLKPFIFKKRQTSGDHAGCCQLATHRRDLAWKVWVTVCQNSCLYVQSHVENVLH